MCACLWFLQLQTGCNLLGKQSCVPGETNACVCSDGEQGSQVCSGHGTSYSACVCGQPQGDVLGADGESFVAKPCINANECDDLNLCTTGLCGADGFCVFTFNTVGCDDGNECTVGDRCFDGVCESGEQELACEDGNPCTDDECISWQGCVSKNNESECEDGDACTLGDQCLEGACLAGSELMECNTAPESDCLGDVSQTYGSPGECTEEGCDYPMVEKDCAEQGDICFEGECIADPGPSLVLNGSLTVTSSEDVEIANQYKEITGDLELTDGLPSEVLLPYLEKVGGKVWIHEAKNLVEISFPKLLSVGTSLNAEKLELFERMSAQALESVGSDLRLSELPKCYQLGFASLVSVGTNLEVQEVDGITNLIFNGLTSIPGNIVIKKMAGLKIFNLAEVETIGGSLLLDSNSELTTLHIDALEVVGGALSVLDSSKVLGINLSSLQTVGATASTMEQGSLKLQGLTALNTLDVGALEVVRGALHLGDLSFIEELGFDSLTKVAEVHLSDNASLVSLNFPVLSAVDPCWAAGPGCDVGEALSPGWFTVSNLPSLVMVKAPSLTVVKGGLQVDQNTALKTLELDGVENLASVFVEDNPMLEDVSLAALDMVGGEVLGDEELVLVADNVKLVALDLSALAQVQGTLTIRGNALTEGMNLSQLASATKVDFSENQSVHLDLSSLAPNPTPPILVIESNSGLEHILFHAALGQTCWKDAFPNPAGVWGKIKSNPLLPQCAAELGVGCGVPGPCDGSPSAPCPFDISGNRDDCSCIKNPLPLVFCQGSEKCGGVLACDDQNPCTQDLCSETAECLSVPIEGSCDDGDPCLGDDSCLEGTCVPGPTILSCDDGNVCTDDACAKDIGCAATPNLADCDDGSVCTLDEGCAGGVCAPGIDNLPCDDGNSCTDDGCDAVGGCVHEVNINLLACDDGDVCTLNDQCVQGVCTAGNTPNPCDDGSDCTLDQCQKEFGCLHGPIEGPCDDGDPCTVGDFCDSGTCQTGPEVLDCSDAPDAHCNGDKLYNYLQAGLCAADICLYIPTITDCSLEQMICEDAKCILAPQDGE